MTAYVRQASSAGHCCDCDPSGDPCACGNCPSVLLECSARGGDATLIGDAEFTSPSTPPKFYRRKAQSGAATSGIYTDSSCTTLSSPSSVSCTYDGVCQYNKVTGALTSTGGLTCPPSVHLDGCFLPVAGCDSTITTTQTQVVRNSIAGACCPSGGSYTQPVSDSFKVTLSDEDTENDAKNRLLAGVGGVWSGWSNVGLCIAEWEVRTAGRKYTYREARWRARGVGLAPGREYKIKISYWRRVNGVGSFTKFQTVEYSNTAGGDGTIEFGDTVPNPRGFQTYTVLEPCTP